MRREVTTNNATAVPTSRAVEGCWFAGLMRGNGYFEAIRYISEKLSTPCPLTQLELCVCGVLDYCWAWAPWKSVTGEVESSMLSFSLPTITITRVSHTGATSLATSTGHLRVCVEQILPCYCA